MERLKAGVVGMGFMGYAHVEALRRLGTVEVAAIASGSGAEKRAKALGISQWYDSYQEMILHGGIDAIHICTPNGTHYAIAKFALEHGVHVLCEKPFTVTVSEAEELCELAKKTGLQNAVNFHNRFYPMANTIRQKNLAGEFGKVLSVQGSYLQDYMLHDDTYSWRLDDTNGKTRVVGDIGSHWMDLAEFVSLHKITAVQAIFQTVYPVRRVPLKPAATFEKNDSAAEYRQVPVTTEDQACLLLEFDHDAIGSLAVSQVFAGKDNELRLLLSGSKQSAQWNSENCCNLILGNADQPNQLVAKNPAQAAPGTASMISYPAGHTEGYPDAFKQCFRAFYTSILNPGGDYPFATFADGLHSMILLDRIYQSAQERRWVAVP
ncbi:Gfo/Idh/MocA family protein [Yeguia hominis]|uniref:Gfo/Idh/MocA family oxidoreductase n=1 Tax=Yeguia hominis TaxID=2763662 RepID=A0A926DCY4_9FIRM|nr:Gfo/Idh/MocA family oxidoreductase [Yeguia hominis]MBC8534705.1 Gfo/Idh/MocA family oxidoreductase [Yeguia hominis]